MDSKKSFLAIFLGSKTSPRMLAWNALPEAELAKKHTEAVAAWKAWADQHAAAIVVMGGPLGKTKRASPEGVADIANEMQAYTVVQAESHAAAAKMFEGHPHFAVFPGDAIEIMEVLPIPAA